MPPLNRIAVTLLLLLNAASPAASDTASNAEPTSNDEFNAPDQDHEEDNFGQDPTRPLWRVDLRQAAFADDDTQSYITLIRTDAPVQLNDGQAGILALRLDVPVLAIADGDELEREGGYGDLLFGAIYIAPFTWTKEHLGLDGVGLGAEFEFPTANVDALSDDRWLMAGVFAFKLDMPRVSEDSFFVPQFKYRFKLADQAAETEDIQQLEAQPEFYFATRSFGWWLDFVSLWDTQEIVISLVDDGERSAGDLFAPIEVTMGKMLGRNTVAALSMAVPIYASDSLDAYHWFLEARVGFLF